MNNFAVLLSIVVLAFGAEDIEEVVKHTVSENKPHLQPNSFEFALMQTRATLDSNVDKEMETEKEVSVEFEYEEIVGFEADSEKMELAGPAYLLTTGTNRTEKFIKNPFAPITQILDPLLMPIKVAEDKLKKMGDDALKILTSPQKLWNDLNKMLPKCLKDGKTVLSCFDDLTKTNQADIDNYASAAKAAIDEFKKKSNMANMITSLKNLANTGINSGICNVKKIPVLNSIQTVSPFNKIMKDTTGCAGNSNWWTQSVKNTKNTFKAVGEDMFTAAVKKLSSKLPASGCVCQSNFGLYFGAAAGGSVILSAEISAGIIVGCDGCNFKIDPWWGWSAGFTSNVGAGVSLVAGIATTYNNFWGGSHYNAASVGPNVYSAGVGVSTSLPSIKLSHNKHEFSTRPCIKISKKKSLCQTFKLKVPVPKVESFTPPTLLGLEIAVSAGLSLNPIDVSTMYAEAYKL